MTGSFCWRLSSIAPGVAESTAIYMPRRETYFSFSHLDNKKNIVFRFIVILCCNKGNCRNLINICDIELVCSVFEPLEPGKLQQTCAESFVVTTLCFGRLTEIICLHFFSTKLLREKIYVNIISHGLNFVVVIIIISGICLLHFCIYSSNSLPHWKQHVCWFSFSFFFFFACLFINNYSMRLVLQALKWNVFHFMNAFAPLAATKLPAPVGILHFLGASRLTPRQRFDGKDWCFLNCHLLFFPPWNW